MEIIIQVAVILFALSVHEAAHGWMAEKFGDPTARMQGRITLNPIAHIDPIGTIAVPLVCIFLLKIPPFGWAKPVPFNPYNLRNPLKQEKFIAAAGPISNITLATAATVIFLVLKNLNIISQTELKRLIFYLSGNQQIASPNPFTIILFFLIIINAILAIFNLIPVPPLDGSKILKGFLRSDALVTYYKLEPYGMIILIILMATGVFGYIINPIINLIFKILFLGF